MRSRYAGICAFEGGRTALDITCDQARRTCYFLDPAGLETKARCGIGTNGEEVEDFVGQGRVVVTTVEFGEVGSLQVELKNFRTRGQEFLPLPPTTRKSVETLSHKA